MIKFFWRWFLHSHSRFSGDLLNRKATGLLEPGVQGMPSHPQFWTDHLILSISTIKAYYAHHFTTCPLDFSDFPTAMSNTKCRQKFQSGWPLSGLWLMSRINDYLKELEQYITHSRLTNETRLAVTKRAQKWIVHNVSCCLNLLIVLEVYIICSFRFQVKMILFLFGKILF